MPMDATLVGQEIGRSSFVGDARRLMSFAAGIPDDRHQLFDTTGRLDMHPLYPVSPEWALTISAPMVPASMSFEETLTGIHYAHDLTIERAIRVGEPIELTAEVIGVGAHRAGALQTVRFVASDSDGGLVWTTINTSLFRGVELPGTPVGQTVDATSSGTTISDMTNSGPDAVVAERTLHVRSVDAHVYSECAQIWNPIHTDLAVARSVGLSAPILHGTATLARAVSTIADLAAIDLASVGRVRCRFGAMVDLDTDIVVRLRGRRESTIDFEVLNHRGERAVRAASISIRE